MSEDAMKTYESPDIDPRIKKPVIIPITRMHPNEWNPNEQTDTTFNHLVDEIREDGFTHPVNLVPCSCDKISGEHYKIIGGEHRWKYAQVDGLPELPAYVHENWDENLQKMKTVRLNLISGELNAAKFTKLVRSLEDQIDPSLMPELFGFDDAKEMSKFLIEERDRRDKTFLEGLVTEVRKEKYALDSLTDIVSNLFAEAGTTIDQNYLVFTYKGAMQIVVLCDDKMWKKVRAMTEHIASTGGMVTEFLEEAIDQQLKMVGV